MLFPPTPAGGCVKAANVSDTWTPPRKMLPLPGPAACAATQSNVWRVGRKHHAAIVCVVAAEPLSPADYRERLAGCTSLVHVSVEVNRSPGVVDSPA